MSIVLLEFEEEVRMAAKIIARNNGIDLKVYADYNDYKENIEKDDFVISSNIDECKKQGFMLLQKPYTHIDLLEAVKKGM